MHATVRAKCMLKINDSKRAARVPGAQQAHNMQVTYK